MDLTLYKFELGRKSMVQVRDSKWRNGENIDPEGIRQFPTIDLKKEDPQRNFSLSNIGEPATSAAKHDEFGRIGDRRIKYFIYGLTTILPVYFHCHDCWQKGSECPHSNAIIALENERLELKQLYPDHLTENVSLKIDPNPQFPDTVTNFVLKKSKGYLNKKLKTAVTITTETASQEY